MAGLSAQAGVPLCCEGFRRGAALLFVRVWPVFDGAVDITQQGDSRQPRTMLWSDGMSAAQARKALFGNAVGGASSGGDSLGACHTSYWTFSLSLESRPLLLWRGAGHPHSFLCVVFVAGLP